MFCLLHRFARTFSQSPRFFSGTGCFVDCFGSQRRKEFLARCGFNSLTEVDSVAGFTRVLNELLVLQLVPCLELYLADVRGYLTAIIEDKTRHRQTDRPTRTGVAGPGRRAIAAVANHLAEPADLKSLQGIIF
jgi:hypothetical protein